MLLGVGVDFDLTPTLRVTLNANQIWFENTSSVSAVRNQGVVDKNLGLDLSLSLTYRPHMIQNVVLRASGQPCARALVMTICLAQTNPIRIQLCSTRC